jgi:excisionase family DNA binding protein
MKNNFLDVNQVATYLGIAPKTIRKYIWERTIPYYKINGHIRFDKNHLDEWITECKVPTFDEIKSGRTSNPFKQYLKKKL